jgi:endoglucanase
VRLAAEQGIYVILDMHDFLKYWPARNRQVCVDASRPHQLLLAHTWRLPAAHFRGEPAVLGYDIMNEPVRMEPGEECSSCHWHGIAQEVLDAFRTVDDKHLARISHRFSPTRRWWRRVV